MRNRSHERMFCLEYGYRVLETIYQVGVLGCLYVDHDKGLCLKVVYFEGGGKEKSKVVKVSKL